jgi:hypothetical protein
MCVVGEQRNAAMFATKQRQGCLTVGVCAGPLQHPQLCIDAVEHGVRHGGRSGLQAEAVAFATAAKLPVHQALVHIFFAQRSTKKVWVL